MRIKDQKGNSAIEFAIVLPLLVVLIFGIIEFGILLYDKQVITNASREGARRGIVQNTPRIAQGNGTTPGTIKYVVESYTNANLINFNNTPNLTDSQISITATDPSGICVNFGDDLTVTVNYSYKFLVFPNLIGLIGGSFGDPFIIGATTVMKCE